MTVHNLSTVFHLKNSKFWHIMQSRVHKTHTTKHIQEHKEMQFLVSTWNPLTTADTKGSNANCLGPPLFSWSRISYAIPHTPSKSNTFSQAENNFTEVLFTCHYLITGIVIIKYFRVTIEDSREQVRLLSSKSSMTIFRRGKKVIPPL